MNFTQIDWADSDLEHVEIEYNLAVLTIFNDTLQKRLQVCCSGLVGITNLCVWDDTTIMTADIKPVIETDNEFIKTVYNAYDKNFNYGGRSLDDGLLELSIELSNGIVFGVYCLNVSVTEESGPVL